MTDENVKHGKAQLIVNIPLTTEFITDFGIFIFHQILLINSEINNPIVNMNIKYRTTENFSFGMSFVAPYDNIKERIISTFTNIDDFWIEIRTFDKSNKPFCIIEATTESIEMYAYNEAVLTEDKIQTLFHSCIDFCTAKNNNEVSIKSFNGKQAAKQKWLSDISKSKEHKWNKIQLLVSSVVALLVAVLGYILGRFL